MAAAHDTWLRSGGRQPCVSVLQSVNKAISGAWSRYDADVAQWKTENPNFLQEWRTLFHGPDGWAMTGPLFESAMELCLFTIILYDFLLLLLHHTILITLKVPSRVSVLGHPATQDKEKQGVRKQSWNGVSSFEIQQHAV